MNSDSVFKLVVLCLVSVVVGIEAWKGHTSEAVLTALVGMLPSVLPKKGGK